MTIASLTAAANAGMGRPVSQSRLETRAGCKVVVEDPDLLAAQAGVPVDQYSLARLIVSEGYGSRSAPQVTAAGRAPAAVAIAQSCLSVCARRSRARNETWTPTRLLTYHPADALRGRYGQQTGRWASTRIEPREWHVEVARQVLAGEVPDLAHGATQFLDAAVWIDGGAMQDGRKLQDLDEILRRWHRETAWIGPVPGIATIYLALMRPERDPVVRRRQLGALLDELRSPSARRPAPG